MKEGMRFIGQKTNLLLDRETKKSIIDRLQSEGCVFAEEETQLLTSVAGSIEELTNMVEKQVGGLPLEYVLERNAGCKNL